MSITSYKCVFHLLLDILRLSGLSKTHEMTSKSSQRVDKAPKSELPGDRSLVAACEERPEAVGTRAASGLMVYSYRRASTTRAALRSGDGCSFGGSVS